MPDYYTIRKTWTYHSYRREYEGNAVNFRHAGYVVYAECFGCTDTFVYTGCIDSGKPYLFDDYESGNAFAKSIVGKSRISATECWFPVDLPE